MSGVLDNRAVPYRLTAHLDTRIEVANGTASVLGRVLRRQICLVQTSPEVRWVDDDGLRAMHPVFLQLAVVHL